MSSRELLQSDKSSEFELVPLVFEQKAPSVACLTLCSFVIPFCLPTLSACRQSEAAE